MDSNVTPRSQLSYEFSCQLVGGATAGLCPLLGSRQRLPWFTLEFVPDGRRYRTLGGPLHYNELIGVVERSVVQQEFLNCPLFNLQEQRGGN